MAWFDNLFAPPMFGQNTGLAPNTYDYFRALYPPHTRPMPEQPQMPYAPPMNPALPVPLPAPAPNDPRGGTFPGFGPQMTGDIPVGEGDPGLPAGELPWLSNMQQVMSGGMPTDGPGLRVRVKPNVMPDSNPPPMMGRAGELPPGVNPPGAMGMGDLAYPGAMSMPAEPPPRAPWGERNKGWLEPLGDALTGLGQGIAATPPGSSPLTYLSQGTAMGAQNMDRAQDRKLDRRLKEAQVGKAEQETDMRKQAIALGKELPAGHPAKKYFQMGMVKEGLEKIDPDYNKLIIVGPDGKPQINELAVLAQSTIRAAGKTTVNVNTREEGEWAKKIGGELADRFVKIQDSAVAATSKIATLEALKQSLSQAGFTGWGAETVTGIRSALKTLGVNVDEGKLGAAETARAIGNQLALQLRNPSAGAGMPGALSDKDREFLVASIPGLQRTPEGNAKLLDYMAKIEQRNIDVARFASQYVARNGRLDSAFFSELAKWSASNPLFQNTARPTPRAPSGNDPLGIR